MVWMYHSSMNYLLIEGCLGSFHFGAITNKTAINICA